MILILTGPSGSGKSTIANKLCKYYSFTRIRTITTRPKRYALDHEYEFVTTKVFEDLVNVGRITSVRSVLSSSKDGRILYGIPTISIRSDMNYVIILDPKGALEFKQHNNDKGPCVIIEVQSNLTTLQARASKRDSFDSDQWLSRYQLDMLQLRDPTYLTHRSSVIDTTIVDSKISVFQILDIIKEATKMNIKHSKTCSTTKPALDDKYIIELAETYEIASIGNSEASPSKLYRVKGFNSLVFDENGLSKLEKYEPTPVVDADSIRTEAINKLYQAFSIAGGMNSQQLKDCFFGGDGNNNITLRDVLASISPEKFIECIESRIVPGDEVSVLNTALLGTVLSVDTSNDSIAVLFPDNIVRTYCAVELTKTGNHVNISITTATDTPEQTVTIY